MGLLGLLKLNIGSSWQNIRFINPKFPSIHYNISNYLSRSYIKYEVFRRKALKVYLE